MWLAGADLAVDHATVAGANLKDLDAGLSAVGIHSDYGGPHSNHATEMSVVSFQDGSYLEMIALQASPDPKMVAAHPWVKFMQGNAGPCAWAARTIDLAAEAKRLQQAGIVVSATEQSGRQRPDGVRLDWLTAQVGTEGRGVFFPFLIQDVTPRKNRAYPRGKPSAPDFTGVTKVVIVVKDLEDAVKRYRQAYGMPAPLKQVDREFGAHLALMGATPVVLAQPLTSGSWLANHLDQFGEGACAFVLGVRKAGHYPVSRKTRWFGKDVSWFDASKLGWRLGFE
jgi:hypothetical protein